MYIHFLLARIEPPYLSHSPLSLYPFQLTGVIKRLVLLLTGNIYFPFCLCLYLHYAFPLGTLFRKFFLFLIFPLICLLFSHSFFFINWLLLDSLDLSWSLILSCSCPVSISLALLASWLLLDYVYLSRSLTFSLTAIGEGRAARWKLAFRAIIVGYNSNGGGISKWFSFSLARVFIQFHVSYEKRFLVGIQGAMVIISFHAWIALWSDNSRSQNSSIYLAL